MAQFYASIKGNRGEATRMGSKDSGIYGHVRGWSQGGSVSCFVDRDGKEVCDICATHGVAMATGTVSSWPRSLTGNCGFSTVQRRKRCNGSLSVTAASVGGCTASLLALLTTIQGPMGARGCVMPGIGEMYPDDTETCLDEVRIIPARELEKGDWILAFRRKFVVHSIMYTSAGVFVATHEPGEQKAIKFTFDSDFDVPVDSKVHTRQIRMKREDQ